MKELVLPPAWAYDHFNERGDSVLRFKCYVSTPHATYLVSDEGSMLVRIDPTNRKGRKYRVQKPNFETGCPSPYLLDAEGKRKGYEQYICHQEGKSIRFYLHRAVAICWVQKRDLFCIEVDHIDDNRFNNRAKNLRWVTSAENKHYNKHKKQTQWKQQRKDLQCK